MYRSTPLSRFRAFTVIEILAVIVIIALAAAAAAFSIYPRIDTTVLRNAGSRLMMACRYAQLTSAQNRQVCRLTLDIDKGMIQLDILQSGIPVGASPEDSKPSGVKAGPFVLSQPVRFGRIRIDDKDCSDRGTAVVHFYPDGTAQAGCIELKIPDETLTVSISPKNGRAFLHRGSIAELSGTKNDRGGL